MGVETARAGGPRPLPRFNRKPIAPQRKRVLIVDDSGTMRALIRKILSDDSRLDVVGDAADPYIARDEIKRLRPDVITLDIEMPRMNGLAFLEKLMRLRPMPVVMLSTLTPKGSDAAIRALSLGAVDCLGKPTSPGDLSGFSNFADKVWNAANARMNMAGPAAPVAAAAGALGGWNGKLVLVGSSTGGVGAIEAVLRGLPADCPPVVITQHMPEDFLASFADRLNAQFPQRVGLAGQSGQVKQGDVLLAPGRGTHIQITRQGPGWGVQCIPGEKRNGHCPSVEVMFESAERHARDIVAVMLTGLGRDGAEAMKRLRDQGAETIGQDEATSVVYGMPRAAFEIGAVHQQLPLERIGSAIASATRRQRR